MTKASINLQDLRRRLYVKAKAETSWKFRGLYVHVRAPNRQGFGWARWSRGWLYQTLKPFNGYRVVRPAPESRSGRIGPISLGAKQNRRAQCEKSACCVRRGGGWKRGMAERWCDTRNRKSETTGNTNFGLNQRASPRPYQERWVVVTVPLPAVRAPLQSALAHPGQAALRQLLQRPEHLASHQVGLSGRRERL